MPYDPTDEGEPLSRVEWVVLTFFCVVIVATIVLIIHAAFHP